MTTILLYDNDLLFKAVEGTCLRRERCRLVKTPARRALDTALEESPDLILAVPADDSEAFRALLSAPDLERVPVLALMLDDTMPSPDGGSRAGTVECLVAPRGDHGDPDFEALDPLMDDLIRSLLPSLDHRNDRVPVSVRVKCRGRGLETTIRTKNISPTGLFLKTELDLAPGRRFDVRFLLPSEGAASRAPAIEGVCEVVRAVRPESGTDPVDLIPGVGVRFVDLGHNERRILERFVSTVAAPAPARHRSIGAAH